MDEHAVAVARLTIHLRPRADADLEACEQLALRVLESDGYPPAVPNDLGRLVQSPEALAAFVALREGHVVGHVCVNPLSSPAVMELATRELRADESQLAVVARLLVSGDHRRAGIGQALLRAAAGYARSLERQPILDVATHFHAAIALYERCGWRRIGMVTAHVGSDDPIDEFVYAAPSHDENVPDVASRRERLRDGGL